MTTAELIAQRFSEKTLVKNEFLLKAEQLADTYFFLESGYLRRMWAAMR